MTPSESTNPRLPSTRWEWRRVKVRQPPEAPSHTTPEAASQPSLRRRNARERLTITITYRGGPECWWVVEARGHVWRRPGHTAIEDLFRQINEGGGGKRFVPPLDG